MLTTCKNFVWRLLCCTKTNLKSSRIWTEIYTSGSPNHFNHILEKGISLVLPFHYSPFLLNYLKTENTQDSTRLCNGRSGPNEKERMSNIFDITQRDTCYDDVYDNDVYVVGQFIYKLV